MKTSESYPREVRQYCLCVEFGIAFIIQEQILPARRPAKEGMRAAHMRLSFPNHNAAISHDATVRLPTQRPLWVGADEESRRRGGRLRGRRHDWTPRTVTPWRRNRRLICLTKPRLHCRAANRLAEPALQRHALSRTSPFPQRYLRKRALAARSGAACPTSCSNGDLEVTAVVTRSQS